MQGISVDLKARVTFDNCEVAFGPYSTQIKVRAGINHFNHKRENPYSDITFGGILPPEIAEALRKAIADIVTHEVARLNEKAESEEA